MNDLVNPETREGVIAILILCGAGLIEPRLPYAIIFAVLLMSLLAAS